MLESDRAISNEHLHSPRPACARLFSFVEQDRNGGHGQGDMVGRKGIDNKSTLRVHFGL
jgi:hypothetical protein